MSNPQDYPTVADYPISQRWPARQPELIQLYSLGTPNGVKVSIALEELGLPYEAHRVTLADEDVKSTEFLSLNPNNKIPAIIDPNGPEGTPIGLFESGAILVYLAEKTGKLMGRTATDRIKVLQWLMFQMGGVGPMFGQLGFFFAYAGKEIEDPRPRERYINEAKRLLNVINQQLEGQEWIAGEYSIADIAIAPWLETIAKFYKAGEVTGLAEYKNVMAYIERFTDRPAVQRGWAVPPSLKS
ncbi:glutathione S-transferase N-terminal domain-containing protein [Pontibacterium granulatum]|uniref:glutathione S-transferase N-terminal domain-containing protein n=1 Tax=Pontibacterium granulatum TaxID=2036029 RepID=UPI00249A9F89|nr:glutathione S-transferase N-terminal domain-containing protein [Pontibacterium granulatum]MDI3323769.1 glutathione S-transferase N-terminal domain-containing protein [Pontibacterium granulatum]